MFGFRQFSVFELYYRVGWLYKPRVWSILVRLITVLIAWGFPFLLSRTIRDRDKQIACSSRSSLSTLLMLVAGRSSIMNCRINPAPNASRKICCYTENLQVCHNKMPNTVKSKTDSLALLVCFNNFDLVSHLIGTKIPQVCKCCW